ncbi:MAG: hypothetical protein EOM80_16990, partial [Erysipelotrichia bacterium]|nr:hypothetical protein [Erysipelotrichia bacterium]
VPIQIDLGMEKLEAELTFAEYDPDLFRLFGLTDNSGIAFTLRGGLQSAASTESVVINLRGILTELDPGSWKPGDKLNLNFATFDDINALPGVGKKMAEKIIEFRNSNGGFFSIEDLKEVPGLTEKTIAKFIDMVEVR